SRLLIEINSVASVTVRIHGGRVAHVVYFVVQDLVAGGREDSVTDSDVQRTGVIHDSLKQVVNVIKGNGVVKRAVGACVWQVASALARADGRMVAVVYVVMG